MTTVAFDGRSMAGDRLYACGGSPLRGPVPKIRRLMFNGVPAVAGGSGTLEYANALLDWLQAGSPQGREPMLPPDPDDGATVIVATADMVYTYSNSTTPIALGKIQWASGSGANYALGAMKAGVSAKRAVEIACELDLYSGAGVDVLTLKRKT